MGKLLAFVCLCALASATFAVNFEYGSLRFYSDSNCQNNEQSLGQGYAEGYCHKYYDAGAEASRYLKYDCSKNTFSAYRNSDCTGYEGEGNAGECRKFDDELYYKHECEGTHDSEDFALFTNYLEDACAGPSYSTFVVELGSCFRVLSSTLTSNQQTCNAADTLLNYKYYSGTSTCNVSPSIDADYDTNGCIVQRQRSNCDWADGLDPVDTVDTGSPGTDTENTDSDTDILDTDTDQFASSGSQIVALTLTPILTFAVYALH